MKTQTIAERLRKMNACGGAVDWAETLEHESMQPAWDECPRGDWLLWYAARVGVDRRLVALAACDCARQERAYAALIRLDARRRAETLRGTE